MCGRWCGSGTLGTERLCWELFALPGFLAPASLHAPDLPPLPFPLSLSLSLASPYAQNLRLISSSAGQSPRTISVQYITPVLWACAHEKWQRASFRGFVTLTSRGAGEKMKGMQRNPVSSSCHCSGVARSDSKISAKALYGKWVCGSVEGTCTVVVVRSVLLWACCQTNAFTCPSLVIIPAHISVAWVTTDYL